MDKKNIIIAARVVSMLFTPFYLPMVGIIALFMFSYMSMMPWVAKLVVITLTYIFTILLPSMGIHWYRKHQNWSLFELSKKERRVVPYLISIFSYLMGYYLMSLLGIPFFMRRILLAALLIQIICAMINVWWKISTHTAAIGGVTGAVMSFSMIFPFNPIGWLSLTIIISGMVGSSRMILRQHTLTQVVTGYVIGTVCALIMI